MLEDYPHSACCLRKDGEYPLLEERETSLAVGLSAIQEKDGPARHVVLVVKPVALLERVVRGELGKMRDALGEGARGGSA